MSEPALVRRDLNIRLILMYHQSWFTFAESGFVRSGPGLKYLKSMRRFAPQAVAPCYFQL